MATATEDASAPPLRLELPTSKLDLGRCLLNDAHILRTFSITNSTDAPQNVTISFDDPLQCALSLQLANENLAGIAPDTASTTSLQEEHFNNLYDEVGVIRSFALKPKETVPLVLCLRPEVLAAREEEEESEPEADQSPANSMDYRAQITFTTDAPAPPAPAGRPPAVLQLRAYLVRSVIKTSLDQVVFDCCVCGKTMTKDFKLLNNSPFPTTVQFLASVRACTLWQPLLTTIQPSEFASENDVHLVVSKSAGSAASDKEVGLGGEFQVPGDAQLPLRLVFEPQRPGRRNVAYEFRNLNNARNVEVITLSALVSQQEHTDALEVSEHQLDFGDCYTGVASSLRLLMRNRGEPALDIFFASDEPTSVSFALPSDLTGLAVSSDVRANLSRIDETVINPGKDRMIEVWYRPERLEGVSDRVACRLTKRRFRLLLTWTADGIPHERLVVCNARVCTSMVATQPVLSLGDCHLGVQKSSSVEVENLSDLPALVMLEFESKVISFRKTQKANIPSKQKYSFAMTFLARKANPDYQKEIKVVNLMNPANASIVLVRARNVEANTVLHSHLYRLVFAKNASSLEFNTCVLHSAKIRTFRIQSACQSPLELHLVSGNPTMLRFYVENASQALRPFSSRPEKVLVPSYVSRAEYLDLAVAFARKSASLSALRTLPGDISAPQPAAERREEPLMTLADLEEGNAQLLDTSIPVAQEQEEAAVTRAHQVMRHLDCFLTDGRLQPLDKFTLQPGSAVVIVATLTAGSGVYRLNGKLQQFESKFTIDLTRSDTDPPTKLSREVLVTAKICQSIMSLAQRNFNFGSVDKKEPHTPTLVINNLSQVPIVYRITKSKTLSSYDLVVDSRSVGVIRPYRSKEVEFLFKPSMSGLFQEKLTVHNVHDPSNSQTVLVKANVRVPNVFYVTTLQLHFGTCGLDRKSRTEKILVVNSSKQRRQVEVIADTSTFDNYCVAQLLFKSSKSNSFGKDVESEVDRLERRIRIALRKNQPEKLGALTEQLNKLKQESESMAPEEVAQPWRENGITVTVEPGAMQTVLVIFNPRTKIGLHQMPIAAEDGTGSILVYESGNIDATQKIAYSATVQFEPVLEISPSLLELGTLKSLSQHLKPAPARAPSPMRVPLRVVPGVVELGDVQVGNETKAAFILNNSLSSSMFYQLLFRPSEHHKEVPQARCRFSHSEGYLTAMGRARIDFFLQPAISGAQSHSVVAHSRGGAEVTVQVLLCATQARYLAYPDLKESDLLINLGHCYVDASKKYAKVEPFRIQNVSTEMMLVTIKSNLATQVFVFQDEAQTQPVENVRVGPGARLQVHVCVQPSLKGDSLTRGNCRELVGGLKIRAVNAIHYVAVDKTVKFHAVVGRSEFSVMPTFVDLGATRQRLKRYSGWITIQNVSTLLPLNYTIECSKRVTLSRTNGQLDGVEIPSGRSADRIQYTISASEAGLYEERMAVVNALGHRIEVVFRLFVDEALLITNLEQNNVGWDVLECRDVYLTADKPLEKRTEAELATAPPMLLLATAGNLVLSLTNVTKRDLTLVPKSNLDVTLSWLTPKTSPADPAPPDASGNRQVGDAFTLRASRKVHVYISFPRPVTFPTARLMRLLQGSKVAFQGTLLFERVEKDSKSGKATASMVSKMLLVEGAYCLSMAELDNKTLDLGRIGYETAWREVPFEFQIKNLSEAQFLGRLASVPAEIAIINGSNAFRIAPFKQRTVKGVLHPKNIPNPSAGACQFVIGVHNDNNPASNLQLQLNAQMTICLLKFGGHLTFIGALPVLSLPVLKHVPGLTSDGVDEWFSVENTSIRPVTVTLEPQLEAARDYVVAQVIPRSATAPVSSFSLNPGETLELRVRLSVRPELRLPKTWGSEPVVLGDLMVRSKVEQAPEQDAVSERIQLSGALVPGTSFALSSSRLSFQIPSAEDITKIESVTIKNPATVPLRYQLVAQAGGTFPASVSATPMEGVVAAGASGSVAITVENWREQAATGQQLFLVQDADSSEAPQKLIVSLAGRQLQATFERRESFQLVGPKQQAAAGAETSEKPPPLVTGASSGQLVQPPPQPPVLQLRGCTPTDDPHRYSISLGQQTVGQENLRWEFSIVYTGSNSGPLEYKLYSTNPNSKSWLSVDQPRGTLEAPGDIQKITLAFKPKACEIFSTFLVLDNFSNLDDVKTIKVYMEGVTAQTSSFSVHVDPLAGTQGMQDDASLSINLGPMYFGQIYSDRSFIINNLSASPLDFLLSATVGLAGTDQLQRAAQVHFSLSTSESTMSLNNLVVPPHSKQVVFMSLLVQLPPSLRIEEEESVDFAATVNLECRMVRNSLRTLQLRGQCRLPQIEVQPPRLYWAGKLVRKEDATGSMTVIDVKVNEQDMVVVFDGNFEKQITLKNQFNTHLQYIAKNDSMFFDVSCAPTGWIGSKYVTHSISVSPNVNTIAKHRKFLLKERAIEEHIVVYNQNRLSEKYRITLFVTIDAGAGAGAVGADSSFQAVPSALHALGTLEHNISAFVVAFNSFWKEHRKGADKVARLDARLAQLEETHEDFALHFEFLHLTDELIFYGTRRSHVSANVFALANLLYITVFKHKIFTKTAADHPGLLERLSKWSKGLRWYLSFFPDVAELAYLRKVAAEVSHARRHKTPTSTRDRTLSPEHSSDISDRSGSPASRNSSPKPTMRSTSPGLLGLQSRYQG